MSFELAIAASLLGAILALLFIAQMIKSSFSMEQWIIILLTWQFVVLLVNYGASVATTNAPGTSYVTLMDTASVLVTWANYLVLVYFIIVLLVSILLWILAMAHKKNGKFKLGVKV